MRLNKLLVVALAGMTMFSCSNNDEMDNGLSNGEEKTVVLKLDGIKSASTRSMDDPSTAKHTIQLNDVAVIFYDEAAGKVLQVPTVNMEQLKGAGQKFENVPASVDRVLVIGNAGDEIKALFQQKNVDAIKKYTYSLAKENEPLGTGADLTTKSNVTLYGDEAITATDIEKDEYTADVKIKPLVARFEVKSIGCAFGNSAKYHKLVLKGIGLVDYYSKAAISSNSDPITTEASNKMTQSDDINKSNEAGLIFDPTENITGTINAGSYQFCNKSATEWAWSFDVLDEKNEIAFDAGGTVLFTDGDKNYSFAYNFFPQDGQDEAHHTPNICAWVEAYESDSGTPVEDHSIVTSSMQLDGAPFVPKAGDIYQLNYIFKEEHIDEWVPTIKVTVKVTVAEWNIVENVQPEF